MDIVIPVYVIIDMTDIKRTDNLALRIDQYGLYY